MVEGLTALPTTLRVPVFAAVERQPRNRPISRQTGNAPADGGRCWIQMSRVMPTAVIPDRVRPHRVQRLAQGIDDHEFEAGCPNQMSEHPQRDGAAALGATDRRHAGTGSHREFSLAEIGQPACATQ